jgi:hypothetical protein
VPVFADGRCHVVSAMDPYGHILGLLDRSFSVIHSIYLDGRLGFYVIFTVK